MEKHDWLRRGHGVEDEVVEKVTGEVNVSVINKERRVEDKAVKNRSTIVLSKGRLRVEEEVGER